MGDGRLSSLCRRGGLKPLIVYPPQASYGQRLKSLDLHLLKVPRRRYDLIKLWKAFKSDYTDALVLNIYLKEPQMLVGMYKETVNEKKVIRKKGA